MSGALVRSTERQSTRRETSDDAYKKAPLTNHRLIILNLFEKRDLTCDEVIALGFSHQSASATINALMRDGYLVDSGERRLTQSGRKAIVWKRCTEPKPIRRQSPTRRELEDRIRNALCFIDSNYPFLTDLRSVLTGNCSN